MAIGYNDARAFLDARTRGVSFRDTLTIAHLKLCLHRGELARLRKAYTTNFPNSSTTPLENYQFGDYSDEFLRELLGVENLSTIDYSSYEGATIVHDLNLPIPDELKERFDVVIDGGSVEHIFNFPVVIANLMNMAKTGGSVFMTVPANNLCGHGLYQFSPELMFRIFSKENGYELNQVLVFETKFPSVELTPAGPAYKVSDPADVRQRVMLRSKRPVLMIVEAKKIENVPLFAEPPLQSDYVALWEKDSGGTSSAGLKESFRGAFNRLPFSVRSWIRGRLQLKRFSFSNRRFFKKV